MIELIKVNDIRIKPVDSCDKGLYKEDGEIKSVKVNCYALPGDSDYIKLKNITEQGAVASIELFYCGGDKVLFDGCVSNHLNDGGFDLLVTSEVVYKPVDLASKHDHIKTMDEQEMLEISGGHIDELERQLKEKELAIIHFQKKADFYEQIVKNLTTFK